MLDLDTVVTWLYVLVDDYCKRLPPAPVHPGRDASLSRSEVITLAILSQWARFFNERDFYRYADRHLRPAFPQLPHRAQLNRSIRQQHDLIAAFGLWLGAELGSPGAPYEAIDCTAARTRNLKRRGRGWLAGQACIGQSNRLGWFCGFGLLVAVTPAGIITGFGFGPANLRDHDLADSLFAQRALPVSPPTSGTTRPPVYIADAGFSSRWRQPIWAEEYGAQVWVKPQGDPQAWSKARRRLHARLRQIVETVNDRLLTRCRLDTDRPHSLDGFATRLAAKVAFHNFCCYLNAALGRPLLAVADLIAW
jgi:Transposase DDE domain